MPQNENTGIERSLMREYSEEADSQSCEHVAPTMRECRLLEGWTFLSASLPILSLSRPFRA